MSRVALCMIVRDSEKTIDALLESVVQCEGGPAFDEYVFVDTGSKDSTREKIAAAFQQVAARQNLGGAAPAPVWPEAPGEVTALDYALLVNGQPTVITVRLARFVWVNDFSAARNYSFSLATTEWRMYLDADDVWPLAPRLRPTLAGIEKRAPPVNAVSMTYDYSEIVKQDVVRLVRWADGWKWIRPIHEYLAREPQGGQRVVSKIADFVIHHRPPEGHFENSVQRNLVMLQTDYDRAKATGDTTNLGSTALSLGQFHRSEGHVKEAEQFYLEAAEYLGTTNLAALALVECAEMVAFSGYPDKALDLASSAYGRAPELREGLGMMALVHHLRGDATRAVALFDEFFAKPPPLVHTTHDVVLLDGVFPAHAAMAYVNVGDYGKAAMALSKLDATVTRDPRVQPYARTANRIVLQQEGLRILREVHDFWNWSCEPVKFRKILRELLPESIAELPEILEIHEMVDRKLPHLNNWEEYQKAYADIPNDTFHTSDALRDHVRYNLGRTKGVKVWAESLPKEGPPVYVAAIGAQDCIIESVIMEANPRVHLCAVDVSPTAAKGIQELAAAFPGRVTTHAIKEHHYDWPDTYPGTNEKFDAVTLFEVIEHVPDDHAALVVMRNMLKPTGTLFLSTPIASEWIEQYLTGPMPPWHFHGHVRGFSPGSLWGKFRKAGFTGSLKATDGNSLFFAAMTPFSGWSQGDRKPLRKLAILCPWTPIPFDPQSLHEGHVGGSEEAVIRLAPKLAARGIEVTVYAGMPDRENRLFVVDGVRWRPTTEFFHKADHGTVLLWRSPQTLLTPEIKAAKWRKFSWLHDLAHGAPPEAYEECEKAIVLSQTAVDEVKRLDGVRHEKLVIAQNGIDGSLFPPITDDSERDPNTCIWASSPNRGLQHLLAIWPRVRSAVPDAKLEIYYDWTMFRNAYPTWAADLDAKIEALKDSGVKFIGGVSHDVLFKAYRHAGIFAMPSTYVETFCTSAVIAQAAGAYPVVTAHGALRETVLTGDFVDPIQWDTDTDFAVKATEQYAKYPDPEEAKEYLVAKRADFHDRYARTLIARLQNPPSIEERRVMRQRVIDRFDWAVTARIFDDIMFP